MIKRLKVKIIWQEEELEKGMARGETGIINYKALVKQLKLYHMGNRASLKLGAQHGQR